MPARSPAPDTSAARTPSLSQRVVDGVAERIRKGDLRPGDRVPTEPALMREYGVSRSVVREAVSRLQAGGLVQTRHGIGSFVLDTTPAAPVIPLLQPASADLQLKQKLAMLELRLNLESEAAALAAQRRQPGQLAEMERMLAEFDAQRPAGAGTAEADFRFHEAIARATGNEYFVHVLRALSEATIPRQPERKTRRAQPARGPRFGDPTPRLRPNKDLTSLEHHAVLDAIRRGDAAAARAAMFMHLTNSRERLQSLGS